MVGEEGLVGVYLSYKDDYSAIKTTPYHPQVEVGACGSNIQVSEHDI